MFLFGKGPIHMFLNDTCHVFFFQITTIYSGTQVPMIATIRYELLCLRECPAKVLGVQRTTKGDDETQTSLKKIHD